MSEVRATCRVRLCGWRECVGDRVGTSMFCSEHTLLARAAGCPEDLMTYAQTAFGHAIDWTSNYEEERT